MSFVKNYTGFTPDFVRCALSPNEAANYGFLLVLECESRPLADGTQQINHPRFCVYGSQAVTDPRNFTILQLEGLDPNKNAIPSGWEKIHQLIYGTFAAYLATTRSVIMPALTQIVVSLPLVPQSTFHRGGTRPQQHNN